MSLEDERFIAPARWPFLPPLPRARPKRDDDQPNLWIIMDLEEGCKLCSASVAEIYPTLRESQPRSVVKGPALTAANEWVVVVNPANETISGPAAYRRAMMQAAKRVQDLPLHQVFLLGGGESMPYLQEQIEGFRMGWFRVSTAKQNTPEILVPHFPGVEDQIWGAELASQSTCWARYWTEQPANVLTPSAIAELALAAGEKVGLEVEVFTPKQLETMGAGGLLAVGSASVNTPRLVTLRHLPSQPPAVGIVGKGITFDSGGISLKPSTNLRKQKGDKAGAMAVLAGALAAAQDSPDLPFLIVLPLAENLIGERAYRPGDVVAMLDGTSVEVISTDAEGRMVLADGISLARQKKCERILSLATLTKAAISALGYFRAALYCEDMMFRQALQQAGDQSGELLWHMPLDADYERLLVQSSVANLAHASDFSGGGSIVAAKFLQHFAAGTTWAHIDMSPSFYLDLGMPWADKGYLGTGGRLVYYLLTRTLLDAILGSN
jgi:leucyl aminopeptidase